MIDPAASPGPDERFFAFLAQGKFMLQRQKGTDRYVFYPRTIMPGVGTADLEWVAASGRGTVYSTSVVRQRPEKGGAYNVALIDLEEGPRVMSRVEGVAPDAVKIGMAVVARIDTGGDRPCLVFDPAEA